MKILYNLGILFYAIVIRLVSGFNHKAKLFREGRRGVFDLMHSDLIPNEKRIWIHCASLGEFEQGRPLIEKIRQEKPDYKIVLTFFSPSGYEVRKNYSHAEYIYYLPLDLKNNAKKFVELVKPEIAFFVKYEFWYHYLNELHKRNIPTFLISGIFRKNQIFFRQYGGWFQNILKKFNYIFVQNNKSLNLLQQISIKNAMIAGDTRFDRVYEIAKNVKSLKIIEEFKKEDKLLVVGSSWIDDEKIICDFIIENLNRLKVIIAPHEIHESNIKRIEKLFNIASIKYSEISDESSQNAKILILDNIGLLTAIYRYADIAYVGGAFRTGLHNILEPATFGIPVLFGPEYQKFKEATDLIELGGAFSISSKSEFNDIAEKFISENELRLKAGQISSNYVKGNIGGTDKIFNYVFNR